jgi:hypothetical protein
MAWMARFRARSPPRPCRYRTVIPLLAGIGLVPPSGVRGLAAAPAGVGEAHDGLGGADRPDAEAAGQAGSDVIDDASSWQRLSFSCDRAWASASARRPLSVWRTACSRLA